MTDRHRNFDADKLTALKSQQCGYRFCPRCASDLVLRKLDEESRMVCTNPECDFIYYQNPVPAAGAIIVEDDRILLVKRAHPPRIGWWCIPAGFMEWKEHPRQTAVRELAEETGLEIEVDALFEVYSGDDDPRANAILVLYLGHAVGGELQANDDAEEVRFFHFDNLPDDIAFIAHRQALEDYKNRYRNK